MTVRYFNSVHLLKRALVNRHFVDSNCIRENVSEVFKWNTENAVSWQSRFQVRLRFVQIDYWSTTHRTTIEMRFHSQTSSTELIFYYILYFVLSQSLDKNNIPYLS